MMVMLDTNTCIALIKRKPLHTLQKLVLCEIEWVIEFHFSA